MNLPYCYKNNRVVLLVMAGIFLVSAILFISLASAAEEAQIQAAIEDLNSATGQNITSEEQAKDLCNQERYLDICADIGKKHNLYTSEDLQRVDDFLGEVKGKVLEDIKSCSDEECLIKVANELAKKIQTKNPTLATNLSLTTKIIEEKRTVVEAAKEVGVNFRDCEAMNPDTAPIDLLRKCAKLAKDARVQKYIPEEKRALADQLDDKTLKLREALAAGRYQCGDGTLEGCGNFCLNPNAGTMAAGIPLVCKRIAEEIFGPEGVNELKSAHQQVGQVKNFYAKKFILTLPNGRELIGEGQIRNACDKAFSDRDLDIAKACGDFAVKNGFVAQEEVDRGLKLLQSFTEKARDVKFEACLKTPAACRDFIPEDDRNRFDAGNQIFEIMKSEIGFDPSQCERGSVDQTIGTKCFEGSKRALAKIEGLGLAGQSQEARFVIEDIKRHVVQGEEFMNKKDEFDQVFSQQGGPGGCRSEAECFTYCSNPTNGPECISFGANQGISGFRGVQAIQRFHEYNQNLQRPGLTSTEYVAPQQFPGQGPYPQFQPPGQGGLPPGQVPGFTQPGPGFGYPPGRVGGFYPGPGPVGPSPECFAAIQAGDFAKAKAVCSVPSIPLPTPQICPAMPYIECPVDQYRESFRNPDGCWVDGPCKPMPTLSPRPYPTGPYPTYTEYPGDANSCPGFAHSKWDKNGKRYCRLNETNSCQYNYPAYLNRANYTPDNCPTEFGGPYPTYSTGPTFTPSDDLVTECKIKGGVWDDNIKSCRFPDPLYSPGPTYSPYPTHTPDPSCPSGQWWDYTYKTCTSATPLPSPYPTYTSTPYPTVSSSTGGMYSCFYPKATKNGAYVGYTVWCERDYFNCREGSKTGSPVSLDGISLGSPSNCESGYQGQSCNNNNFCDSNETYSSCPSDCGGATFSPSPVPTAGGCPSGYHYHGESDGFCLNDQENYGGICYNSSGTSRITCPVQPSYTPTPAPSCPAGQWWDSARNSCTSTPTSCSAGYYWDSASNMCKPSSSATPYPSCPSGQWWDNMTNSCRSSTSAAYCGNNVCDSGETSTNCISDCGGGTYTPYPTSTYTYTPPPSCPSGQWWDSATNSCQGNIATYTPYPTMESTYSPVPTVSEPPPIYSEPPPAYSESPPPTSLNNQYMVAHCQQLGRTWDGKICQASGLFARFYENNLATVLRFFYIVP